MATSRFTSLINGIKNYAESLEVSNDLINFDLQLNCRVFSQEEVKLAKNFIIDFDEKIKKIKWTDRKLEDLKKIRSRYYSSTISYITKHFFDISKKEGDELVNLWLDSLKSIDITPSTFLVGTTMLGYFGLTSSPKEFVKLLHREDPEKALIITKPEHSMSPISLNSTLLHRLVLNQGFFDEDFTMIDAMLNYNSKFATIENAQGLTADKMAIEKKYAERIFNFRLKIEAEKSKKNIEEAILKSPDNKIAVKKKLNKKF